MLGLIEKYEPKVIFHTAFVPVSKIQNPNITEFRVGSLDTTINLLDCIVFKKKGKYKLSRLVYISSSMVMEILKKQVTKQMKQTQLKYMVR